MRIVAQADPELYRSIHAFALKHFEEAKKYYHVTTDLSAIKPLDQVKDCELPEYFADNNARQLIHITYGLILNAKDADGKPLYKDRLYKLWREHEEEYAQALEKHIGKHLELLGCPKA